MSSINLTQIRQHQFLGGFFSKGVSDKKRSLFQRNCTPQRIEEVLAVKLGKPVRIKSGVCCQSAGKGWEGSGQSKDSGDSEEGTELRTTPQAPQGGALSLRAVLLPRGVRVSSEQRGGPNGSPGSAALTPVSARALHHDRVAQRLGFIDHF